jgi:LysM repeat protein
VKPGDNLRSIANLYGVSAASIARASGLQDPDQLRVGQVLTIPNQTGTLYRVQPGETLDDIAARTGVSGSAIAAASDLTTASVSPGQVILIPDGSAGGSSVGSK